MFKAAKEFTFGDQVIAEGQEVKNPSVRMQELGLVVEVPDEVEVKTEKVKTEKPKKEKKEVEKTEKVEETKTETLDVKDELLTEVSSDVTVEKTEE
jgi:hypothetical protein